MNDNLLAGLIAATIAAFMALAVVGIRRRPRQPTLTCVDGGQATVAFLANRRHYAPKRPAEQLIDDAVRRWNKRYR